MQSTEEFIDHLNRRVERLRSKNLKDTWRIHKDIKIFINDDFLCPLCNKWFKTGLVYMVDEARRRIIGCWYADTMQPVSNYHPEVIHPHADSNGGLCMGTATNVAQLLFNGISPGKHYFHTDSWLLFVGHECPNMVRVGCAICGLTEFRVRAHLYANSGTWVCSAECHKIAVKSLCRACGVILGHGSRRNVCAECFPNVACSCFKCGHQELMDDMLYAGGFYVCPPCYETETFPCGICHSVVPIKSLYDRRCERCQIRRCRICQEEFRRSHLSERMECGYCVPRYVCPCGSPVRREGDLCRNCRHCGCCLEWREPFSPHAGHCIKCVNCLGGGVNCAAAQPITEENTVCDIPRLSLSEPEVSASGLRGSYAVNTDGEE